MYCSVDDIYNQLDESFVAQLSNDDNPHDTNSSVIEWLIGQASSLIDGYIRDLYTVPISPIPPIITRITANITCYYLYLRRGIISDHTKELYSNSIDDLTKIKNGIIKFDIDSNIVINKVAISNKDNQNLVFSKKFLNRIGRR